jgi:hypothetical protein
VADEKKVSSIANKVVNDEPVVHNATPEEIANIKACRDAIDNGHDVFAVRYAREFMDSTNADVRLEAVGAFGWIGKIAIKELAEMMADPNEDVASEAQRQWEMAFDEYSSEVAKMRELERAVGFVKDQAQIEAVMMKFANLEDYNSVKILSGIITSTNFSPIVAEVAREEYALIADEPFLDLKRAEQVAKALKDKAEGLVPVAQKENKSKKNSALSRVPRGQGKEKK